MPAVLDSIYVALFAVAWPFYDYFMDCARGSAAAEVTYWRLRRQRRMG
jgi:hypothetical protein